MMSQFSLWVSYSSHWVRGTFLKWAAAAAVVGKRSKDKQRDTMCQSLRVRVISHFVVDLIDQHGKQYGRAEPGELHVSKPSRVELSRQPPTPIISLSIFYSTRPFLSLWGVAMLKVKLLRAERVLPCDANVYLLLFLDTWLWAPAVLYRVHV